MADNTLPLFADSGKFYVYIYRDPRPGKKLVPIYVGKGTAAHGRADVHWKKGARNPLFKAVLDKIKARNREPVIEIVAWFDSEYEAFQCEQRLIEKIGVRSDGGSLCNLLIGDTGGGWTHSEETKEKIREARAKQPRRLCSEETKTKIRQSNIIAHAHKVGIKNPEHGRKLKGRKLSPEHRAAISAGNVGRTFSAETIEKIRISNSGQTRTAEARKNMSESHLGNIPSEETMLKMSASQQLRWDNSPEEKIKASDRMKGNSHALIGEGVHTDETRKKVSAAIKEWWRIRKSLNGPSN
ncbi:MAG TPA: NUMOD3 domain-containing DNA-binding protein [Alphaproteobacteria bacterium]|nr:NUMOD3 domain-containing DNA-binding protein [Alphaproteobacteria bacterium]